MSFLGTGSTTAKVVSKVSGVASKKIKSDVKELESAISSIDKAIDEYNGLALRLNRIAGKIPSAWEGAAADAYLAKLKKQSKSMVEMSKLLLKVRESATKRKNKLIEREIWTREIHNSAEKVGKGLKVVKVISKIF